MFKLISMFYGMRHLSLLSILFFSMPLYASAEELTLNELLEKISNDNPDYLLEKQANAEISINKQNKGFWPDPQIQAGRENDLLPLLNSMGNEEYKSATWVLSLTQEIPWPGVLQAQKKPFSIKENKADITLKINTLARKINVVEKFLALIADSKKLIFLQESYSESANILKITQEKRKYLSSAHSDVLQLQIDLLSQQAQIDSLKINLNSASQELLLLAGYAQDSEPKLKLDWPAELLTEHILNHSALFTEFSTENSNADLQEQIVSLAKMEALAEIAAEREGLKPALMANVALMREDNGMYMYNAMVGIKIPISANSFRNNLEKKNELIQNISVNNLKWYAEKKRLNIKLGEKRFAQAKQNIILLHEKILPLANQHYNYILQDFAQGNASLTDLNKSRKNILSYKLSLIEARKILCLENLDLIKIKSGLITEINSKPSPELALFSAESMGGSGNAMNTGKSNEKKNMGGNTQEKKSGNSLQDFPTLNLQEESIEPSKSSGGMGM